MAAAAVVCAFRSRRTSGRLDATGEWGMLGRFRLSTLRAKQYVPTPEVIRCVTGRRKNGLCGSHS